MFPVVRVLLSPEIILHALVLEARIKLNRASSGSIKVRLGDRRLGRVSILHKDRIEGTLDALLQIHGITDDYRPVIDVRRKVCHDSGNVVLYEVSIEVPPRITI